MHLTGQYKAGEQSQSAAYEPQLISNGSFGDNPNCVMRFSSASGPSLLALMAEIARLGHFEPKLVDVDVDRGRF